MDHSTKSIEADKADLSHVEILSDETPPEKLEVHQSLDMSPKEQWRKLWKAIQAEKRFCLWTLYTMLLVFSWGYDAGLSGVAIAFPEFRKAYGNYYALGDENVIPALWQSLWNAASTIGQVFGGYAAGQFADFWGRKVLLYTAVFISLGSSFALVFAPSLPVLFVSKATPRPIGWSRDGASPSVRHRERTNTPSQHSVVSYQRHHCLWSVLRVHYWIWRVGNSGRLVLQTCLCHDLRDAQYLPLRSPFSSRKSGLVHEKGP